jgi:hypothetical protein
VSGTNEWRKTERGKLATQANSRAQVLAAAWMRKNHPEAWRQFLAQARAELGLPTEIGPGGNFTKAIEHGTQSGFRAHMYRKEKPCRPCLDAHNAYQKQYRASRA